MEWNPNKIKIFRTWFTNDLQNCEQLNLRQKYSEIKALYKV